MEEGIFLYQARTAQGIALNILRPPPHFLLFSGKKSVGGGNFCFPLPVGRPAEKKWGGEEEEEEEANKQTSRLWPGAEERRTENRGRRRREKERGKRASTSRQPPLRRLILLRIAAHFFV